MWESDLLLELIADKKLPKSTVQIEFRKILLKDDAWPRKAGINPADEAGGWRQGLLSHNDWMITAALFSLANVNKSCIYIWW